MKELGAVLRVLFLVDPEGFFFVPHPAFPALRALFRTALCEGGRVLCSSNRRRSPTSPCRPLSEDDHRSSYAHARKLIDIDSRGEADSTRN